MPDCPNLTEVEKKIAESRLTGKSFFELEENEIRFSTDQIIFRCAAEFGCALPSTEGFAEIISDELLIFIKDFGYGELTVEEVFLAMRLNSKGGLKFPSGVDVEAVVFTGNCVNVNFISKILSNYLAIRNILDRKLQNLLDGHV